MKFTHFPNARLFCLLTLLFTGSLASAQAQQTARIKLDSLDKLEARASKVEKKDEKAASGEAMVYVRHYEFKQAGEYQDADLQEIRAQLQGPGWSRFIKVEDKGDHEKVDVYLFGNTDGDVREGMTVVVTEPTEVTVVNIVGQVGLDAIKKQAEAMRRK